MSFNKKEYQREYMKRKRSNKEAEKSNILVLSDGQMLDKQKEALLDWHKPAGWNEIAWSKAMAACNRARDEFVPNASLTDAERRALHLLYDSAHHPDGTYKEPTKKEIDE